LEWVDISEYEYMHIGTMLENLPIANNQGMLHLTEANAAVKTLNI